MSYDHRRINVEPESENPACSICGKDILPKGTWTQGNNAAPVNNGRCCDNCNNLVVIPTRLAGIPAGMGNASETDEDD